jgi:hypothetical protein
MGETAEDIFRRAQTAAGLDGRLAMPPVHEWETFPFEGDIRVRPLEPPVEVERPRFGAGGGLRAPEDLVWSLAHTSKRRYQRSTCTSQIHHMTRKYSAASNR